MMTRIPNAATIDDLMNLVALVRSPDTALQALSDLKEEAARMQAATDEYNAKVQEFRKLEADAQNRADLILVAANASAEQRAKDIVAEAAAKADQLIEKAKVAATAIKQGAEEDKAKAESDRDQALADLAGAREAIKKIQEETNLLEARLAAADRAAAEARAKALGE